MVMLITPKAGFTHNPLLDLRRNTRCPCRSGKKVKKCCGRQRYVAIEVAEKITEMLKAFKDDLKFKDDLHRAFKMKGVFK